MEKTVAEALNQENIVEDSDFKEYAQGCIFGTFVGDSCGSYLEFEKEISEE